MPSGRPRRTLRARIAPRRLGQAVELAGAAGQHQAPAEQRGEAGRIQPVADEFQDFVDARLDDPGQRRARHLVRHVVLVVVERRHRQQVALVGRRRASALPYIVFSRSASSIRVDRPRAMSVVMCWPPTAMASAWTNWPRLKTAMVVVPPPKSMTAQPSSASSSTSTDKAAGVGRGDHALDRQMAAVEAKLEIAERRRVGGDDMHVDAEPAADHAARIGDAALAVERIADRQRMDDGAAVG